MSVAGDTMLGRLVDLLQPAHVAPDTEEEALYVKRLRDIYPDLKRVDSSYPFGNLLPIFQNESDVNIINLETAITTHATKWPHKAFNYRMHPMNVTILQNAKIDYCSLANNHILDYGVTGLWDTMRSLARAGISYAGMHRRVLSNLSK
jgi:poly-gamma-glutamate capsule biosynthesis protein CapA/YwtB (metallophosphatase superfamily)